MKNKQILKRGHLRLNRKAKAETIIILVFNTLVILAVQALLFKH